MGGADHAEVRVLTADEHLLVVDKPSGLLAVPGRGEAGRENLVARLEPTFGPLLVAHRLDMATSGLMVFARHAEALRRLHAAFASRSVRKRYLAVVAGTLAGDEGAIDLPIGARWPERPKRCIDPDHGRPSLTRWRVLAREDGRTRLELEPVTGRTHQLRVHLAAIGHPILGDALYAPAEVATASARLLLHASHLALAHPSDGRPLAFDSAPEF